MVWIEPFSQRSKEVTQHSSSSGRETTPRSVVYTYLQPHLLSFAMHHLMSSFPPAPSLSPPHVARSSVRVPPDNKFSSFVRQLNFYGFRKVKSNITVEGHDSKWWEFKVRYG